MRKLKYILVLLFCSFTCILHGHCETYKCEYKFSRDTSEELIWILEFNIEDGTVKNHSEEEDSKGLMVVTNNEYSYEFIQDEIKTYKKNVCPLLYLANNFSSSTTYIENDYTIYSNDYLRQIDNKNKCITSKDKFCWSSIVGPATYYYTGTLTQSDINKDNVLKSICASFDVLYMNLSDAYDSYFSCKENKQNCAVKEMEKIKSIKDDLKNTCSSMLQYSDVTIKGDDGSTYQSACIEQCLKLGDEINKLEQGKLIEGQCNVSHKLIVFIRNILRWIKYLIPAVVIVLGILDFIKAIGADKDDEMKKAQGRFIKRLIAAVLIFLIPLIIEFVLGKMGFGYNDCGLFK